MFLDHTEPPMSDRIKTLSLEARKLPIAQRAELIDDLLASLDEPDPRIDALWAEEAERRIELLDAGKMTTRDAAEVMAKVRERRRG
jgi:putative addiction module component (TIGR02574 family)